LSPPVMSATLSARRAIRPSLDRASITRPRGGRSTQTLSRTRVAVNPRTRRGRVPRGPVPDLTDSTTRVQSLSLWARLKQAELVALVYGVAPPAGTELVVDPRHLAL